MKDLESHIHVLGIDLASRDWRNNGSAIVSFTVGDHAQWHGVEYGSIQWPLNQQLTPVTMANVIEETVSDRRIVAVSMDGPQGWREPNAPKREGVGRVCEYQAKCQGKTGVPGICFPQTQLGWISHCISLFAELMNRRRARIINAIDDIDLNSLKPGDYYLLECFPTSTWRENRLTPLPGKARVGNNIELISAYWNSLKQCFDLPLNDEWQGSHDDLQAIVATLPAVGLLKGPCQPLLKGIAGRWCPNDADQNRFWVEGIIWDAKSQKIACSEKIHAPSGTQLGTNNGGVNGSNPILIDDRDDDSNRLLDRGIRLFRHLARCANENNPRGVGYAQLVCCVYGVDRFENVANRPYRQADTRHVLELAQQITDAAGGHIAITRNGVSINAKLDTFIWRKRSPHVRPQTAFENTEYTQEQWLSIFPDGQRQLLNEIDCIAIYPQN